MVNIQYSYSFYYRDIPGDRSKQGHFAIATIEDRKISWLLHELKLKRCKHLPLTSKAIKALDFKLLYLHMSSSMTTSKVICDLLHAAKVTPVLIRGLCCHFYMSYKAKK